MHLGSLALIVACLGPPVEATPEQPAVQQPSKRAAKLPRDGGGPLTLGGILLVAGVGMAAGSITLATMPWYDGEGWLGLGAVLAGGAGAGILAVGVKTRRKFRTTELGQVVDAPATGRALHAGAATAMTLGSISMLAGHVMLAQPCRECEDMPSEALAAFGTGSGLLLAGSIMLIVSQVRQTRYRRWLDRRTVRIQPSFSIGAGAMQIGLSGRF